MWSDFFVSSKPQDIKKGTYLYPESFWCSDNEVVDHPTWVEMCGNSDGEGEPTWSRPGRANHERALGVATKGLQSRVTERDNSKLLKRSRIVGMEISSGKVRIWFYRDMSSLNQGAFLISSMSSVSTCSPPPTTRGWWSSAAKVVMLEVPRYGHKSISFSRSLHVFHFSCASILGDKTTLE